MNSTRFLYFFGLIWLVVTLGVDGLFGYGVYRQTGAASYPAVPGVVTHSEVIDDYSGGGEVDAGPTYRVDVKYDYEVGKTKYTGDKVRYGVGYGDEKLVRQFVKQHPRGTQVTVYYNPDEPGDAVLETGVQHLDYFLALFIAPFNFGMLFVLGMVFPRWREGGKPLPAGGVAILQRPDGVHLRLTQMSPPAAAGLTAFVISLVSVFGVGLWMRNEISATAVQWVWGVVGLAFVGVYLWRRYRAGSGLDDLVIDVERGVFSLPQTQGRHELKEYAVSSIRGVEVEEKTAGGKNGGYTTYLPKLVFADEDGLERREPLIEWRTRERADALADWLNGRLEGKAEES